MKRTTSVFFFALAALTSGCGYDGHDICDDKCDCEGCSDYARNVCYDQSDSTANKADRLGCGNQYDDWVGCVHDTQYCSSTGHFRYSCDLEESRLEHCIGG